MLSEDTLLGGLPEPTGSLEGFYDIDVRAGEKLTGIDGACTFTGPT